MSHTNGRTLLVLAFLMSFFGLARTAMADDFPLVNGDYWEVSGIKLKDGGSLAYAKFLADQWRKEQEFAKSKGWIKDYKVLVSPYPRHGEPDVYLIVISQQIPSGAEMEKRNVDYMAWIQKSNEQLDKESGNRVEIREIFSGTLLQEMTFRK